MIFAEHQLRGARLDSYRSRFRKMYTPDDDLCVWLKGIKSLRISSQSEGDESESDESDRETAYIVIMIIGKLYLIYS